MRRLSIFALSLGAALILLAVLISWYVLSYQAGNATMSNMMGQMMGSQYSTTLNPMPAYFWASMIALFAVLTVGLVGAVYYLAYPEIRQSKASVYETSKNLSESPAAPGIIPSSNPVKSSTADSSKESWSALLRTSTPEEKRILEVLSAHNGVHLQKLIVKETGLSKLRTHRIISRFAGRGIVNVTKSGNTNEVRLAPWLNQPSQSDEAQ
ncbi:MAG: hypothetical protein JRN15_09725 [Nitrososphaerota archaeon]|nr:hypothetical protein [Nitrososphaerota archaeon]